METNLAQTSEEGSLLNRTPPHKLLRKHQSDVKRNATSKGLKAQISTLFRNRQGQNMIPS